MWPIKCGIINFKQYGSIQALNQAFGDHWVYIGRVNSYAGLAQSPLANPFKVKDFGGRGNTLPLGPPWAITNAGCGGEFKLVMKWSWMR